MNALVVECSKKKKAMHIHTATNTMLFKIALVQNPQNSPQTPLGNPHNTVITTSGIGGDKYKFSSAFSPFKHCIMSTEPNFEFNNFVSNFE